MNDERDHYLIRKTLPDVNKIFRVFYLQMFVQSDFSLWSTETPPGGHYEDACEIWLWVCIHLFFFLFFFFCPTYIYLKKKKKSFSFFFCPDKKMRSFYIFMYHFFHYFSVKFNTELMCRCKQNWNLGNFFNVVRSFVLKVGNTQEADICPENSDESYDVFLLSKFKINNSRKLTFFGFTQQCYWLNKIKILKKRDRWYELDYKSTDAWKEGRLHKSTRGPQRE